MLFRSLDILFAVLGILLFAPILIIICIVGLLDTGSPFVLQRRVGKNKDIFVLVKFRTMRRGTRSMPSHLVDSSSITTVGSWLRRSKLDELPQLWNVLVGDMSVVGPRPCLPDQTELIEERESRGVFAARPGITGLAQVNKIDMSTPELLAKTDARMLADLSVLSYLKYIVVTVAGKGSGDRVSPTSSAR